MVSHDAVKLSDMVRSIPGHCLLSVGLPVLLAAVQLANSLVNGLSLLVSVPFTVVLMLFAVVVTQHQFAEFRRQQFERTLQSPAAD